MKRNLFLSMSVGTAILMATTGCLPEKKVDDGSQAPQVNPRDAVIKAMKGQATSLIQGINKVVISGDFMKNVAPQNPPEPIPLETENDVTKAIDYLFANQQSFNSQYMYSPDARICSEIIAKNNPATCEQIMKKVKLVQTVQDSESGAVQLVFDSAYPAVMIYSGSLISVSANLDEIAKTAQAIDAIKVQNGEPSFAAEIPSVHTGVVTLTAATKLGMNIVDLTISEEIHLAGTNHDGQNYSATVLAANNVATLTLNSALGYASVAVNLPAAALSFPARDNQDMNHNISASFPGLSGTISLDNLSSKISALDVKLLSSDVVAQVDGQDAIHLHSTTPINADLTAAVGGNLTLTAATEFSAQLEILSNPLIDKAGTVTATVSAGTQVYFAKNSEQAKLLQGEFSLIGTQDFTVNLNAQANTCFAGVQNTPFYLEPVACQ